MKKSFLSVLFILLVTSVCHGQVTLTIDGKSISKADISIVTQAGPPSPPPSYRGVIRWSKNRQIFTVAVNVQNSIGGSVVPLTKTVGAGDPAVFTVITNPGYAAVVSEGMLTNQTWTIPNVTVSKIASVAFNPIVTQDCSSQYISGVVRASAATAAGTSQCWFFDVPQNTSGLLAQIIGTDLNTNAVFSWTFPDGRVLPGLWGTPDKYNDKLIGPGTASINVQIRSQSFFAPNIEDVYIPAGRHIMRITGTLDGFMSVGF